MFIIRRIAESRLLASFEQNNINGVKQWLAVLYKGKPFEKSYWNYIFSSGKHLPEILIDKSNHHWEQWQNYRDKFPASQELNYKAASSSIKNHLLLSQVYTQGLLSFLKLEKEEVDFRRLRWWHRLLIWIDKKQINANKKVIEKPYDQDKIKQFFKNVTLEGKVEGKEKPLVTRLLKSIEYRFFNKEFFHTTPKIEALPQPAESFLPKDLLAGADNIWLKPLTLQQAMNQNQVLQGQIDAKNKIAEQLDVDALLLMDVTHDAKIDQVFKKFKDTSTTCNISNNTFSQFQDTPQANYTMIRTWLNNLKVAYGDSEPEFIPSLGGYSNRTGYLKITQAAIEILKLAPGLVIGSEKNVRCKDLPLGFFICPESLLEGCYVVTPTYILSFSEKYREWQIQNKDKIIDFPFRADPFANLQPTRLSAPKEKQIAYLLTPQSFLSAPIDNFSLEEKHVQFIARCLISEKIALNLIIQMMGREFFIAFIEELSTLEKHRYQNCFDNKESHTILQDFMIFLKQVKKGNEFNDNDLKNLNQLTQLTDTELSWFYLASNDETRTFGCSAYNYIYYNGQGYREEGNYSISFRDLSSRLFYFFNFLESFDPPLSLPTKGSVSKFRFNASDRLNDILICLSQVDNPWIQAKLMTDVPNDFPNAQKKLRDGYCIVHEEMIFGDEETAFEKQCAILGGYNLLDYRFSMNKPGEKEDVLKKISYASIHSMKTEYQGWAAIRYFKAVFLRYLAINTNAEIFLQGLQKWNDSIPDYSQDQTIESPLTYLETHWENLKNFAIHQANQKQENTLLAMPSWHTTLQEENATYFNTFLTTICSKDEEVDNLQKTLTILRNKETGHLNKPIKILINDIKEIYEKKSSHPLEPEDILDAFSLICACYHHPQSPLKTNKKPLRMEQISIILRNLLAAKTLFQIETGEGKTLIIQLIALTRALLKQKSDILTHNEFLSAQSYYELEPFSSLLGIKIAQKTNAPQDIIGADIFYIDAVTAVSNKLIADISKQMNLPGKRTADYAFVDEVDNILIDIHAHTTMQIAEGINEESDHDLEVFLMYLNQAIEELIQHLQQRQKLPALETREDHRRFIIERIATTTYYQTTYETHSNDSFLDEWITAAYTCLHPEKGLKKGIHYILEEQKSDEQNAMRYAVRIVHKDTSGRVDRISQWSAGVHQCVAAWEKKSNPLVKIPAPTRVIIDGNIVDHLKSYHSVSAFSGTLGSSIVQEMLSNIVHNESGSPCAPILVPRARKELPIIVNVNCNQEHKAVSWPKFIDTDGKLKERYTRSHHFTRALAPDHQTHYQCLFEAIRSAQDQKYSTIVFFETIAQCEVFSKFLTDKKIDAKNIQIWDDTQTDNTFHPPEETVIRQASNPRKITLTTAAGSRGTHFRKIDTGILATPGLERVTRQKIGRLGRLFDLGITYEIYCVEDLEGIDTVMIEAKKLASSHAENKEKKFQNMRLFIQPFETKKQQHDLDSIQQRKIRR